MNPKTPKTTCCVQCGHGFDYEPIALLTFELHPTICSGCEDRDKAGAQLAIEDSRRRQWRTICPPLYRDTDLSHPAMPPAAKLAQILNWSVGPKGLMIHGPTRTGKTRVAWLLIRRLVLEGTYVHAITSRDFARDSARFNHEGSETLEAWLESMIGSAVLFIDDLGKEKLTERVEVDLFDVIESRAANHRPIIYTSNFVGETLSAKMTPDRGPAILGRIREFCTAIHL
jgi:DNA replication protein DnaC